MTDTTKFDVILDVNSPTFAKELQTALGVQADDTIEIATPQFERVDGLDIKPPLFAFEKLPELSDQQLKAIGCSKWELEDENKDTVWLFPYQWYGHIPEGFLLHDIFGATELFERGKTDDDMRYGVLAYGIKKTTPTNTDAKP